jgi:hypothetical protein
MSSRFSHFFKHGLAKHPLVKLERIAEGKRLASEQAEVSHELGNARRLPQSAWTQ